MELQEVEVFIEKDGSVRVEVRGVKGMSCLDVTRGLEAALGGQVQDRQLTPEAQEAEQQQTARQQHLWGG
jgi:hypothetical protein